MPGPGIARRTQRSRRRPNSPLCPVRGLMELPLLQAIGRVHRQPRCLPHWRPDREPPRSGCHLLVHRLHPGLDTAVHRLPVVSGGLTLLLVRMQVRSLAGGQDDGVDTNAAARCRGCFVTRTRPRAECGQAADDPVLFGRTETGRGAEPVGNHGRISVDFSHVLLCSLRPTTTAPVGPLWNVTGRR